jgi:hypothetical protein
MNELKTIKRGKSVIRRKTGANPEGKGVSGVLLDWYQSEPRGVVAKPRRQVLAELFTSTLVLSATFRYRPVVGARNYLYWIDDEWSLSLIAPAEWSHKRRAGFAGMCTLQRDMTWTIAPSDRVTKNTSVSNAMSRFFDGFVETLDTDQTLEDILPFYVARLPYFQRLYASALSRSVQAAVTMGAHDSISCRQWNLLLPQLRTTLLNQEP